MKPTPHFRAEWERLAPLLQQALDRTGNTHDIEDVYDLVLEGKAQFWPRENAVGVTELCITPNVKFLSGWLAAGEMEEVLDLTEQAAGWGRNQGCTKFKVCGRKGWVRAHANSGFRLQSVVLERDL